MASIFSKLLSAGSDRKLKKYQRIVQDINALEPRMQALDDEGLAALTTEYRKRYAEGETLEDLLPEAFATVREAAVRTIGQRHYDVQLIGGMVLNDGMIAEMKTGEGKTLVSTLAGYLNAIPQTGVHIVTVNDYLAKRDSEWMGQVYRFLGVTVGLLQSGMPLADKGPAYAADVTYGTNTEFGFDYLRDNMVTKASNRVQRSHSFAIVDEVDSILIDEARTPLIISGAGTRAADTYNRFARVMPALRRDVDFEMDEAKMTIATTDAGLRHIENLLGIEDLYNDPSGQLPNHLQQALRAQFLFHRDQNYVVMDGEVKIVDEFTGRILEGRRYSEGLHQALEAKEGVLVREENQTLATITLQNYFRLYGKLAGMTGTAVTEDAEFQEIYKLPVQVIPPNKPVIRKDENDQVYRNVQSKFNAVADEIEERHSNGQPVLVGTVTIESSERLSRILQKRGIQHEVLNAKFHEKEAHVVAQAGRVGAVTIATNMAGRGTDILLGGNPDELTRELLVERGYDLEEVTEEQREAVRREAKALCDEEHEQVIAAGGLCVIGTERHDSRRIDNQLRGRSGRQGDPGVTQFYLSLEDDLMRKFGGEKMDRIAAMMERSEMPEDMPIQNKLVSKAIENAQHQVELMNFSQRKNVLEYDDVMNKQREVIYEERNNILDGKDLHERIDAIILDTVERHVEEYCPDSDPSDDWNWAGLKNWYCELTGAPKEFDPRELPHEEDQEVLCDVLADEIKKVYAEKGEVLGEDGMRILESQVMLRVIDTRWMNHLQEMDYLKTGIGLRALGQRDPLTEYKSEAYQSFGYLVDTMYEDFLRTMLRLKVAIAEPEEQRPAFQDAHYSGPASPDGDDEVRQRERRELQRRAAATQTRTAAGGDEQTLKEAPQKATTYVKDKNDPFANVGRNDPCPCGSGKKYKKCHGAVR
ncbi:MAG: preprotein translocase subunit SecA [Actinomycetota bacterium]|nr:preprotein translocase subunit SecA [Actinomycetota bacterium]